MNFTAITDEAGITQTLFKDPTQWISDNLKYVFGAAGIILLLMLITAGYQIIFSKGDPKAMQVAQSRITTSLVGIVILFAAYWISQIVLNFLGVNFGSGNLF